MEIEYEIRNSTVRSGAEIAYNSRVTRRKQGNDKKELLREEPGDYMTSVTCRSVELLQISISWVSGVCIVPTGSK